MRTARRIHSAGWLICVGVWIAACDHQGVQPEETHSSMDQPRGHNSGRPVVKIAGTAGSWQIFRNGEPVFIYGAAGDTEFERLRRMGGNVVRTYGQADLAKVLPQAREAGVLVIPGIWLPHERHGFSYDDAGAVAEFREHVKEIILTHRDNPDILLWALGNEMEGDGRNVLIWKEINHLAELVKSLDDRPVATIIAGADPLKLQAFSDLCPAVDVLGINSYGGLPRVFERMREFLPGTPYMICEFGPRGPWESPKTPWGVEIEQTSTEKAGMIERFWREHIEAHRGYCLGGFIFRWGWKQEATHTWFGLFLEDGTPTSLVDGLGKAWNNEWPHPVGPVVMGFTNGRRQARYTAGEMEAMAVRATCPSGGPLRYQWTLFRESDDRRMGGDAEATPEALNDLLQQSDQKHMSFQVPPPGQYRLFVAVYDDQGRAGTANLPFISK